MRKTLISATFLFALVALAIFVSVARAGGDDGAKRFIGQRPPEIEAKEWWNTPKPITLKSVEGRVVLLEFFGTYNNELLSFDLAYRCCSAYEKTPNYRVDTTKPSASVSTELRAKMEKSRWSQTLARPK